MEMVRMSMEVGMFIQNHPGLFHNYNRIIFNRGGKEKKCDILVRIEYTCNLWELLNKFINDARFRLVVFIPG
jgi:glucuronate isomerase